MKIYFEDGVCDVNKIHVPKNTDLVLSASKGVSVILAYLDWYKEHHSGATIYTNSILALDNKYAWNEELKVPEIYIRGGECIKFVRIDTLTEREIRKSHNIAKMYLNREFFN